MKRTRYLTQSAIIAALYILLALISNMLGMASGGVQLRLSEALTVLPFFTSAAVPALAVGCAGFALISGAALWDLVFGTAATLLAAVCTRLLRRKSRFLAPIPPIVFNVLILPPVLAYVYGAAESIWILAGSIFIGQFLSCFVLGLLLLRAVKRLDASFFD